MVESLQEAEEEEAAEEVFIALPSTQLSGVEEVVVVVQVAH